MKKIVTLSSLLLSIVFLAGCGQQPVSQTQQIIPDSVTTNIPVDWKTYTSNEFGVSISIPNEWKYMLPGDSSLVQIPSNWFEGYAIISSPNQTERMVFVNDTLDIKGYNCQQHTIKINGNNVNEITCGESATDEIPGKFNYQFIEKKLTVVFDKKTETIDKIINSIK